MRKIICDRCGNDCAGRIGKLILIVEDQTQDGKTVGETQFEPLDLDGVCIDTIREMLGFKVAFEHHMSEDSERVEIGMSVPHHPDAFLARDHP
jgi:hypothetical protein